MQRDDEAELTEAIYDAALDPAVLDDVIARIRERLNASISFMFADDAKRPVQWNLHGLDEATLVPYAEHYHPIDDFKHALVAGQLLRSGVVFVGERIVDASTLRRSAFVNEFLRSNDFGPHCGSAVHVAPDGLVVQLSFFRPVGTQEFEDEDVAFLRKVVPHLGRAARLRLRLEQQARPPAWTADLLNALPWGVILLDPALRPVLVNREAERILHQADGLRLDGRGLFADHLEASHRLRSALNQASASGNGHLAAGADLLVSRPSGAPGLLLTIVPLGRRVLDQLGARGAHGRSHRRPGASASRELAEAALARELE